MGGTRSTSPISLLFALRLDLGATAAPDPDQLGKDLAAAVNEGDSDEVRRLLENARNGSLL